MNKHPIQPIADDGSGVVRFKVNKIVEFLLDTSTSDMNTLARRDFSQEDRVQFAQLIGYSVSGFSELSYVDDDTYDVVTGISVGFTEEQARINSLENKLNKVRFTLRELVPELFRIHSDDLKV